MTDARDEAERRYPYPADAPFSAVRSDLNAARQSAFIAGAEWAREQPVRVTDDMVERAARAIMRAQGLGQFLSSTGWRICRSGCVRNVTHVQPSKRRLTSLNRHRTGKAATSNTTPTRCNQ